MNFETVKWNPDTYRKFQTYLWSLQDIKYRDFHSKLIQEADSLIGIRTPILKEIAKTIAKNQPYEFLKVIKHDTYEEKVLHGLLIGYMKISFDECILLLQDFLSYNTNWAINDITCANLKIWKKHLEEGFVVIKRYLKDKNLWTIRFGLVLLLDFYINDTYIDSVLALSSTISGKKYYVGMANAWLLSICYVHYPKKTMELLKKNILDDFTQRRAIQKIIESNRVSGKEKEQVRKLRAHLGESLI